jgi:hypothetical protein
MRLHPCAPPAGPLEHAPVTALRPDGEGDWAGFWAGNGTYYARRVLADGPAEWFQVMAEEEELLRAAARLTPRAVPAIAAGAPRRTLTLVGRVANAGNAGLTLVWGTRRRRA